MASEIVKEPSDASLAEAANERSSGDPHRSRPRDGARGRDHKPRLVLSCVEVPANRSGLASIRNPDDSPIGDVIGCVKLLREREPEEGPAVSNPIAIISEAPHYGRPGHVRNEVDVLARCVQNREHTFSWGRHVHK